MNKIAFLTLLMFSQIIGFGQAKMQVDSTQINLGVIKQGAVAEHVINYKNVGDQPLFISKIKTSCSCTATEWSKQPLAPGDSSTITIRFNSGGKLGNYSKGVNIFTNEGEVNLVMDVRVILNSRKPEVKP